MVAFQKFKPYPALWKIRHGQFLRERLSVVHKCYFDGWQGWFLFSTFGLDISWPREFIYPFHHDFNIHILSSCYFQILIVHCQPQTDPRMLSIHNYSFVEREPLSVLSRKIAIGTISPLDNRVVKIFFRKTKIWTIFKFTALRNANILLKFLGYIEQNLDSHKSSTIFPSSLFGNHLQHSPRYSFVGWNFGDSI